MNHDDQTITLDRRFNLGLALEYAAKAMRSRFDGDVSREAGQAMRYLTEFLSDIQPTPTLTEREGEFASAAHTYLRKYTDDPLSTLLYRLIADGIGWGTWAAFVKGAVSCQLDPHYAVRDAMTYARDGDLPANTYMELTLRAWVDAGHYAPMVKEFRANGWFKWLPKTGKIAP